jgi:hypothetical protein
LPFGKPPLNSKIPHRNRLEKRGLPGVVWPGKDDTIAKAKCLFGESLEVLYGDFGYHRPPFLSYV